MFAAVLSVALPVSALAQSPFSDWPEPSRPAAKPAPAKKPAAKPVTTRAAPAKSVPAKTAPAKAAPTPAAQPKLEPPMKVVLVRSATPGCEPNCAEWISAEGRIVANTGAEFRRVFARLGSRRPPILLSSMGGDVDQAQTIAQLIRNLGLDIVVAKTNFQPCDVADKTCRQRQGQGWRQGTPSTERTICASACPMLLAGGVRRFVGADAFLGVHQIQTIQTPIRITRTYRIETRTSWGEPVSQKKTLVSEKREALRPQKKDTPTNTYLKLRDFFRQLGVTDSIVMLYLSAPHDKIHWITRSEQLSTRIATHFANAPRVLSGESIPPAALPARPIPPQSTRLPFERLCGPDNSSPACRPAPTDAATKAPAPIAPGDGIVPPIPPAGSSASAK